LTTLKTVAASRSYGTGHVSSRALLAALTRVLLADLAR